MDEIKNTMTKLTDEKRLHESARQPTDALMEIDMGRLEDVAGGTAGPHDPYGTIGPHDPYATVDAHDGHLYSN